MFIITSLPLLLLFVIIMVNVIISEDLCLG